MAWTAVRVTQIQGFTLPCLHRGTDMLLRMLLMKVIEPWIQSAQRQCCTCNYKWQVIYSAPSAYYIDPRQIERWTYTGKYQPLTLLYVTLLIRTELSGRRGVPIREGLLYIPTPVQLKISTYIPTPVQLKHF